MRVITCNLNGIRSAHQKGFFEWVKTQDADFICLQETRAQMAKTGLLNSRTHQSLYLKNYKCFENAAFKAGYSGVAIYAKEKPLAVHCQMGVDYPDQEGRFIQLDYPAFSVISIYFPSGTSGEHRQQQKYKFMAAAQACFLNLKNQKKPCIFAGDFNIAHQKIDIKNWRANQKHPGFLPEERAWLDKLLNVYGFIDAFRVKNQQAHQYTWWSHRGEAYKNNTGWRIDYQIVTSHWAKKIQDVSIYKEKRFSDHAPLTIDYK